MNLDLKTLVGATVVGLGVVGAVLGLGSVFSGPDGQPVTASVIDSKAIWDGGEKLYLVPFVYVDGGAAAGFELRDASNPPCKRRPTGVSSLLCMRLVLDGGILTQVAVPLNQRLPANQLTGLGCEGVACSVWEHTNADGPEQP